MTARTPILVIVAVPAERDALGERCLSSSDVCVQVAGVGRANAAAAVATALARAQYRAVLSVGIAGSLPRSGLKIGDCVVATECVYAEEGVQTPQGFRDMTALGFPLGDFAGNRVPVDAGLLAQFGSLGAPAPIATVATCSGTDALADEIARRTGAAAEAMEGAAVVHIARAHGVPALEIRTISNPTGDRANQPWDIPKALQALRAVGDAIAAAR